MELDRLTRAVREQVALGRVLPLGTPADALWITERAAAGVLRAALAPVAGVRLGTLRIGSAAPTGGAPEESGVPGRPPEGADAVIPPGAVPRGPLRIAAAITAGTDRPLPDVTAALRRELYDAAHDRLGLDIAAIDLDVTALTDGTEPGQPSGGGETEPAPAEPPDASGGGAPGLVDERLRDAVRAVPGVARLTARLGGFASGVRCSDVQDPPARRVRVQVALGAGHPAAQVARDVLTAALAAAEADAPGPVTAAVVVTDIL